MYVVTNRIEVPAERAAAFEERFISNMRHNLPKVQGLSRATLDKPVDPAAAYKVTMEFVAESDFITWRDSEAFRTSHGRPANTTQAASSPAASAEASAPRPATGPEHHTRLETFDGTQA
ncbi:antibiotic biosynthesis monooxygenase [Paeniglutamicibacter sp. Y32M11]|uniref:antibiotic biosynthesis monooxygenase family protein n=1 Tax=Paeniglutamicibacter sp. Y32M11 TaxID=2853258 RepID=UPI001C5331A6|nr:antibiotic biosynthesis monooxygenase [Paeniglutamicibacter sp. Y32M11]QXQ09417.1 antibiotic biosynthesis monooxygenase [Paeniglutamicibacter sp. Y32M11]